MHETRTVKKGIVSTVYGMGANGNTIHLCWELPTRKVESVANEMFVKKERTVKIVMKIAISFLNALDRIQSICEPILEMK